MTVEEILTEAETQLAQFPKVYCADTAITSVSSVPREWIADGGRDKARAALCRVLGIKNPFGSPVPIWGWFDDIQDRLGRDEAVRQSLQAFQEARATS